MVVDSDVDKYATLKAESIMMIGEQFPSRVVWLQIYDSTDSFEESDIRQLLLEVSQHITKGSVPSGSARKFLDGKLIYYEAPVTGKQTRPRVYAIFTNQVDNIYSPVKKAVEAVATRGGVYSAQRFFNEMIDILEHPAKLEIYEKLSTDQSLKRLDIGELTKMNLNELGLLVSHLNQSRELDFITLEKIYFHIYQTIQELNMQHVERDDPDEFLDAAYVVGQQYEETDNFHLALELFKHIIPVARKNERFDLEVACRIQISTIYKNYFPMSGEYILETLEPIETQHLKETNNRLLEIYYCLLGYAYGDLEDKITAVRNYKQALNAAEPEVNAPLWIAEAYNYLGKVDHEKLYLKDATRYYLTASTIAFTSGDLTKVDEYRNNASRSEINNSNSLIQMALIHRMEMDHKDAEYRAWEALRLLMKAYIHAIPENYRTFEPIADEIIDYSRIILKLPGKEKINREIIDEIELLIQDLLLEDIDSGNIQDELLRVSKLIEENIPIPPPTFMLLSMDGRLMSMGKISDEGWEHSDIEGTLLSGILSAIMSLISEVSDEESSLRTVDAGNLQIMIEQSENVVAVLLVDRDIQEFRNRLVRLLDYIDSTLGERLKYWDGMVSLFDPVVEYAKKLLAPSIVAANMD